LPDGDPGLGRRLVLPSSRRPVQLELIDCGWRAGRSRIVDAFWIVISPWFIAAPRVARGFSDGVSARAAGGGPVSVRLESVRRGNARRGIGARFAREDGHSGQLGRGGAAETRVCESVTAGGHRVQRVCSVNLVLTIKNLFTEAEGWFRNGKCSCTGITNLMECVEVKIKKWHES
jgi:hypothetical protein